MPGIDSNDLIKTRHTVSFYLAVLSVVPIIDVSATSGGPPVAEDEHAVRLSTAFFSDWVALVLDRLFVIFEQVRVARLFAGGLFVCMCVCLFCFVLFFRCCLLLPCPPLPRVTPPPPLAVVCSLPCFTVSDRRRPAMLAAWLPSLKAR